MSVCTVFVNMHKHHYMYIFQVVVGDQLTCKNIHSSKLWRQNEKNTVDTLAWAHETPGTVSHLHTIL